MNALTYSNGISQQQPAATAPAARKAARAARRSDAYLVELAAFFGLLVVAVLERISPREFSMVLLYVVPVSLVAWFGVRGAEWRMAVTAVCVWVLMDSVQRERQDSLMYFWLLTEKVVLFCGASLLFSRLRLALANQRRLSRAMGERLRVVEQLAAGVAHEVRNPLGTLVSGLEYMSRRERPESERQLVEDMHSAVERAEVIVRDLNDFSAPLKLAFKSVDIQRLICSAAKEARNKADPAGVTLTVQHGAAQTLDVDPTRVIQVLVNLLRNAVDVTERGGSVRVRVTQLRGYVSVDVEDDGPGIPPERLAQVFEPFYTTKAPGAGTGLGLAVSRRIAQDHQGELRLANRAGGGLRASIVLPTGEKE
ncbi:MAG: HAMP domain-containing histidine kinase [Rubrivivax sp.]|nr:MAG: HAMP domain-containing histidine kinase [Rubrivivax sp.]